MAAAVGERALAESRRSDSAERHLRPRPADAGDTLARAERAAMARHLELRQQSATPTPATAAAESNAGDGVEPDAEEGQRQKAKSKAVGGSALLAAKRSVKHLLRHARRRPVSFLKRECESREESSRSPEMGSAPSLGDLPERSHSPPCSPRTEFAGGSAERHEVATSAATASPLPPVKLSLVRVRRRKRRTAEDDDEDCDKPAAVRQTKRKRDRYQVKRIEDEPIVNGELVVPKEFCDRDSQTDGPDLTNAESQCCVACTHSEAQASVTTCDADVQSVVSVCDASTQRKVHRREKECQAGCVPDLTDSAVQTEASSGSSAAVPDRFKSTTMDAVSSPQRRVVAAQSLLLLAAAPAATESASSSADIKPDVAAEKPAPPSANAETSVHCSDTQFWQLASVCVDAAGGARSLHCDWRTVCAHYGEDSDGLWAFCRRFVAEGTRERREAQARYTIAVVSDGAGSRHGCVGSLPKLVDTLAELYPKMPVKVGSLTSARDTTTVPMAAYREKVHATYAHGTFRYGPLEALTCVGRKREECGTVMDPLLDALEAHPVLAMLTPWSCNSIYPCMKRENSDDGPIIWVRPGEQLIPVDEVPTPVGSPSKPASGGGRASGAGGRRAQGRRYVRFDDRTPCHADCSDNPRRTTAAVGLVQAVHAGPDRRGPERRPVKDVIVFDAASFEYLLNDLLIDIYEPPMNQAPHIWVDEAKLNELRRAGVRYTRLQLLDGDVYFLPRNTVHQFRSVSAVCSVAWHVRLKQYERKEPIETLDIKVHI